jgi:anti-sigma factor RsiW
MIEARLSDYVDGLLARSERVAFETHVDSCSGCAPLLASVKGLVGEMRTMEEVEVPPRLVYAILDKTLGPRETVSGWQALKNFLRGFGSVKFAYGAASVMATFIIVVGASGSFSLRKPKLADLRPATVLRNADRQVHLVYARSVKYVSDMRVVYEIQSRLRQDQSDLQRAPEESLPKSPEKNPGQTDDQKPAQPRQQNRANQIARELEVLAAGCPVLYERSFQ